MAAAEGEEQGSEWRVVVRTLDGDDGDQGKASSGVSRAKGRLSALSVASGSGGSIAVAVESDSNRKLRPIKERGKPIKGFPIPHTEDEIHRIE